jgi:hypothetical protein
MSTAAHRLPQGHRPPSRVWTLRSVSLAFGAVLGAALPVSWNVAIWLVFPATSLTIFWTLYTWLSNRPKADWLFGPGPNYDWLSDQLEGIDDASPDLAPVEALPSAPRSTAGPVWASLDPDCIRSTVTIVNTPPVPRIDPRLPEDRFAPYTVETVTEAAQRMCWARWNFTRYAPMQSHEAAKQFNAANGHAKEQWRREAFAVMQLTTPAPDLQAVRELAFELDNVLNPRPDEPIVEKLQLLHAYLEDQPCTCDPVEVFAQNDPPCDRCDLLGMRVGVRQVWA